MKYLPLFNNLLVKPIKDEGVIVIDDEKYTRAEVITTGPGEHSLTGLIPINLSARDIVHFYTREGTPITLDGINYLLVNAKNILVVELPE